MPEPEPRRQWKSRRLIWRQTDRWARSGFKYLSANSNRGLSDLVEIRYYNDGDLHSKALLIDDEFIVFGSQNFSYNAWDDGAMLENYFGVEDPQAVNGFKKTFEYHWEHAITR